VRKPVASITACTPPPAATVEAAISPADSAQDAADALIGAGVKIVFSYSEALLDVPSDVNVHTSNPAVALLYALYFHLA